MELKVRFRTDHEICATWGPVVIRISDGVRTEIEDLVRVQKLFDELLESHKTIAILLVLTHGTPPLDATTQRHAKESMVRYKDRLVLSVALLGLGFWASTMRGALGLLVRVVGGTNMWLEGSVERAVERLSYELVGIHADALMTVYQQLWDELVGRARRAS